MEKKVSGADSTPKKDGSGANREQVKAQLPDISDPAEATAVNPTAPRTARRSLSASRRSARTARSVSSESSVEVPTSGSAAAQGISVVPEMKSGRATSSSAQNTKAILDLLVALVGTTPERKSIMSSEQQTPKTSMKTARDSEQGSSGAVSAPNENASPRPNTDPGPRTNPLSALSSRTAKSIRTSEQNRPKMEVSAENPLSALSSRTAQSINSSNQTTPKRTSVERGCPLSALSSRTAKSIDSNIQTTPKRTAVERDGPLSALSSRTAKSIRTSNQNTPRMESAPCTNPPSALSSRTAKSIRSSGQTTPKVVAHLTAPSEDLVLPHSVETPHTPQPVARLSPAPRSRTSYCSLPPKADVAVEKVPTEAPPAQPNTELNRIIVRDLRAGMLFGRSVIDAAEQSYFESDAGRVYDMNGQTEHTAPSNTVIEKKVENMVTKVERESSPAPPTATEDAGVVNITARKEDGSLKYILISFMVLRRKECVRTRSSSTEKKPSNSLPDLETDTCSPRAFFVRYTCIPSVFLSALHHSTVFVCILTDMCRQCSFTDCIEIK